MTYQESDFVATPLGRAAVAYATRLRLSVLPVLARKKEPDGRLAPRGFLDASRDTATIRRWWAVEPSANIGVACAASGIVVVDVDPRNGGDETLATLEHELGPLPRTWTVLTPGGGAHYYLRQDEVQVAGVMGPGVDLKYRGYVLAPPSVHPNGGVYRWDLGAHPLDVPIASVPAGWSARMRREPMRTLTASDLDARESFLGEAFATLGWLGRPFGDGRRAARCPWVGEHSDGRGDGRDSSTVVFPCAECGGLGAFVCSHGHCAGRNVVRVVRALPREAIDAAARAFPKAYRRLVWRLASARGRTR